MSAKRLLVVVCLVALALSQEQQQPQPDQEQQQAQQGDFQCTQLEEGQQGANLKMEDLAGNETAVLFEIGSSKAVKDQLQKGCTCNRNQFMYLRIGSREGLITNSLCKLEERDAEARVSGILLPTEEATVEGVKRGVRAGEDNKGKFGFVLLDVDDPRLPQPIQDEWKELRKERLSALLQTVPQQAKEQAVEKATGEKEGEQQPKKQGGEQQQPARPIQRMQRRLLQQQQQPEQAPPKQEEKQPEQQKAEGHEDELKEGPLATFSPVKQAQEEPINVHILEHNTEQGYVVLTGGCKEFVWILAADPTKIDEEAFNNIKNNLANVGVENADQLQIEKTEVSEECIQEGRALSSPLAPEKVEEKQKTQKTEEEKPQQQRRQ